MKVRELQKILNNFDPEKDIHLIYEHNNVIGVEIEKPILTYNISSPEIEESDYDIWAW